MGLFLQFSIFPQFLTNDDGALEGRRFRDGIRLLSAMHWVCKGGWRVSLKVRVARLANARGGYSGRAMITSIAAGNHFSSNGQNSAE